MGGLNFDLCNHRMGDNSVDRSYLVHQTMTNQTRQLRIRYYERKSYLKCEFLYINLCDYNYEIKQIVMFIYIYTSRFVYIFYVCFMIYM